MATVGKTITVSVQQDAWIAAQIEAGRYTNDSEAIRDLIRREQERMLEVDRIRESLDASIARGLDDAAAGRTGPSDAVFERLEAKYRGLTDASE